MSTTACVQIATAMPLMLVDLQGKLHSILPDSHPTLRVDTFAHLVWSPRLLLIFLPFKLLLPWHQVVPSPDIEGAVSARLVLEHQLML